MKYLFRKTGRMLVSMTITVTLLMPSFALAQTSNNNAFSALFGALGSSILGNIIGSAFLGNTSNSSGPSNVSASTFGGKIITELPCSCPPGLWVTIGPPKGGSFFIPPTAKIYANSKPVIGAWVLGDYSPVPGMCSTVCGPNPIWYPFQGVITRIGTS